MRISTQVFFQRNVNSVLDQQSTLNKQNMHLAAQKRVLHGADDPVAIATIQRLKQEVSVGEQYLKNTDTAESANSLEDTALTQVTNILQRVRELVVSAGNDSNSDESRDVIAKELEGLREELIGVANTKDGNSQYIFSGFQLDTKPFQTNEFGDIDYHGDNGTSNYKVGPGVFVQGYDSGSSVFFQVDEGNGTFVSELGTQNSGSGVISEGSVIDKYSSPDSTEQDYAITISELNGEPAYSVFGLKDENVDEASTASINITQVAAGTAVNDLSITFEATATPDQFEVLIGGISATPAAFYNSADSTKQTLELNGVTIEVGGVPVDDDEYIMNQFVEPTKYQSGQSIEFNGIKTAIKGEVQNLDSFTLRQSDEKDVFSTIQDSIDSLLIKGDGETEKAQRLMAIETALLQIDNSMSNVSSAHTSVGTRLNTIENQREATLDFNLTNQKTLSNIEDLDMAAAISEFQMQMSMLEISQQTFVKMQSLSLFQLI